MKEARQTRLEILLLHYEKKNWHRSGRINTDHADEQIPLAHRSIRP
jgi:hypothetical protein